MSVQSANWALGLALASNASWWLYFVIGTGALGTVTVVALLTNIVAIWIARPALKRSPPTDVFPTASVVTDGDYVPGSNDAPPEPGQLRAIAAVILGAAGNLVITAIYASDRFTSSIAEIGG